MSGKSSFFLVAAAALLFAFIFWVEHPYRIASQVPVSQSVLAGLDPAKVSAVDIQFGGGARVIRAERTNLQWQLTEPVPYPAEGRLVEKLLHELADWNWDSVIDHPSSWEEYGLVQDQFTLTLEQEDGQRILNIGNLSPVGDKVYLNVRGSHQIFVAVPDPLKWVPTNSVFWRDRSVVNLNDTPFHRLRIATANGATTLEVDASGRWRMFDPTEARADTLKINLLLTQLLNMRVSDFPPDDLVQTNATSVASPPETKELILTFLRDSTQHDPSGTNKAMELQMGSAHGRSTNLAYARRLFPTGLIEITNTQLLPWEGDYTNFLDRHLLSVPPELISSIAVEGGGIEKFTVQKTADGPWQVACTNGETFLADDVTMRDWINALTNIQVNFVRSPVIDKVPWGLDQPANALLHYQIYAGTGTGSATNPPPIDLLFGRGTNQTGQIYEMGNDEKTVNTIEFPQFDRLARFYWQLRDRDIWHFDSNEVVAIAVHQEGADLRFTRDAQNQWSIPKSTLVVPIQAALDETVFELGRLRAVYWSGLGETNLAQFGFGPADYRISLEVKRKGQMETNTIEFGQPSPYLNEYASVMRDGRRFIFELDGEVYSSLVAHYLSVPPPLRKRRS